MQLHHINIKGPRELLEAEKQFFCEVLGLREGERPNFRSRGYWLYSGDNAIVHLSESDAHIDSGKQGCFDHVAFQTSNLKQFVRTLEDMEIGHSMVYLDDINMTQIFCKSPSGTGIEINFQDERI